jgi:hypothetical protein
MLLWAEALQLSFSGVVYPDSKAYRNSVHQHLLLAFFIEAIEDGGD